MTHLVARLFQQTPTACLRAWRQAGRPYSAFRSTVFPGQGQRYVVRSAMIRCALICRTRDGLPLSANTDETLSRDIYQNMKLIGRMSGRFPDRCSYILDALTFHFISALGVTYIMVCDSSYPAVLAFSYLNEVQKEFIVGYEKEQIESFTRPYSLIKFDLSLQKVKQRYNNPRSLTMKLNLSDLSQELKLRPVHLVSPEELLPNHNNTYSYSDRDVKSKTFTTTASLYKHGKYLPVGLLDMIAISLCCFCGVLNLTRGVTVINEAHVEDFDSDHYQYAATFIVCFFLSIYQVYLTCYPVKRRRSLACATLASLCLCQLYLWEYRNNYLIVFHVTVACVATFVIFTRKVQEKLPQYML